MNRAQAKVNLAEIRRSTATKHPKVLIVELCGIVQFLLGELERIETPKMTVLTTLPKIDEHADRIDPVPIKRPNRSSPIETPQPWRSPPIRDPYGDSRSLQGEAKDTQENEE